MGTHMGIVNVGPMKQVMKHSTYIGSFLMILFLGNCTQEKAIHSGELPKCIQTILDQDTEKRILRIRTQFVNGEYHYWINTDARHLDGSEDIVSESCQLVCELCGFCIPPDCLDDYDDGDWQIIWKR